MNRDALVVIRIGTVVLAAGAALVSIIDGWLAIQLEAPSVAIWHGVAAVLKLGAAASILRAGWGRRAFLWVFGVLCVDDGTRFLLVHSNDLLLTPLAFAMGLLYVGMRRRVLRGSTSANS